MKAQKIIIKKVVKKNHGGHHGGQWKVAYADFVTAMMAFFLLLWLLTMVSQEKRAILSQYFKHFTIFEKSGQTFLDSSAGIAGQGAITVVPQAVQTLPIMKPEEFKEVLKKAIEEKLQDVKDQVYVDIFEGGVRVQLIDTEGKPMFNLGSAEPTPLALRILHVVGESILPMPNSIAIEGHTDSLAYRTTHYTNWELSTERALSARKVLEKMGFSPTRFSRVSGYADTVPFVKEDPTDARNRRISLILLNPKKD
ncbi:MAG: OmpA family protein [Thermodesulfovibrionales bacterium]|nr:OmpA family protein [Thermodesulfovibrionales bacterium]